MLSGHGCIRLHKMALPLIERGHEISLLTMKACRWMEAYHTMTLCHDVRQLTNAIEALDSHVDVWHAHNEPSWFVAAIKERTDTPIILDVHDSFVGRKTEAEHLAALEDGEDSAYVMAEERVNFQIADALVFPGSVFANKVAEVYRLQQPTLVVPSAVPRRFFRYNSRPWIGGLVYEGKINTEAECQGAASGFRYCDYSALAAACEQIGMDFHIYSGRPWTEDLAAAYPGERTYWHRGLPFDQLLAELAAHDWGLVGNIESTPEWDVAFPNKMFEYLAAGTPVVAMNACACAEFVEQHGIGIAVSSLEELAERWSEHRDCRANVIRLRQRFAMEAYIPALEQFYEHALATPALHLASTWAAEQESA